ncbi:MAG: hypothetical protein MOGMAGMI_00855 [Candidatus Omnitrophica bacterium]|nr:hypothetical protein [Candidatus Omnitrophota bacterium]
MNAYVQSGPQVLLTAALWFWPSLLACYGAGRPLAALCPLDERAGSGALRAVLALSMGLFVLSLWVFAAGSLGLIGPVTLAAFIPVGVFMALARTDLGRVCSAVREGWTRLSGLDRCILAGGAALAALTYVAAHAPESANDSLAYHLYFPKLYVDAGRLVHDATHPRSLWPSLMGMLYTAGLSAQGVALAKLYSWTTAVLAVSGTTAAAVYLSRSAEAGRVAAILVGTVPALWMQSFCAYNDNAMALYVLVAAVMLYLWVRSGYGAARSLAAGASLAALLSVKYYTFVPAAVLSIGVLCAMCADRSTALPRKVGSAVLVVLSTTALCGHWYLRSWLATGNPVFPFAAPLFGGEGFSQRMVGFAELPKTPLNFLLLPWNTAMRVDELGGEPIGCLWLAALPCLVTLRSAAGFARAAAAAAAALLSAWFLSIQHARFLLPALPVLGLVWADCARCWRALEPPRRAGRILLAILGLIALTQTALAAYYPARYVPAALGTPPAAAHLMGAERTYAALSRLSEHLGERDVLVFVTEPRLFYSPVRAILLSPLSERLAAVAGQDLAGWLRSQGATHFLTTDRGERSPWTEAALRSGLHRLVVAEASVDVEAAGEKCRYTLWTWSPEARGQAR